MVLSKFFFFWKDLVVEDLLDFVLKFGGFFWKKDLFVNFGGGKQEGAEPFGYEIHLYSDMIVDGF